MPPRPRAALARIGPLPTAGLKAPPEIFDRCTVSTVFPCRCARDHGGLADRVARLASLSFHLRYEAAMG